MEDIADILIKEKGDLPQLIENLLNSSKWKLEPTAAQILRQMKSIFDQAA